MLSQINSADNGEGTKMKICVSKNHLLAGTIAKVNWIWPPQTKKQSQNIGLPMLLVQQLTLVLLVP